MTTHGSGVWVLLMLVFVLTHGVCRALHRSGAHPLRSWQGTVLRRGPDGELKLVDVRPDREVPPDTESPVGTVPGSQG